jgi:DNA-binding response OmpR family regulator
MSGLDSEDVQGYVLMAGANGFLLKPFTADALLAQLKALLGE